MTDLRVSSRHSVMRNNDRNEKRETTGEKNDRSQELVSSWKSQRFLNSKRVESIKYVTDVIYLRQHLSISAKEIAWKGRWLKLCFSQVHIYISSKAYTKKGKICDRDVTRCKPKSTRLSARVSVYSIYTSSTICLTLSLPVSPIAGTLFLHLQIRKRNFRGARYRCSSSRTCPELQFE